MSTKICATAPYYTQLLEARAEWEAYAETLPEDQRLQCKKMMNEIVGQALQAIRSFYFSGATCAQLQKQAGRLVIQLNSSALNVCEGHLDYEQKKSALNKAMNKIDRDAKNPLPPSSYKSGTLSRPKSLHKIASDPVDFSPDFSVRGAELAQGHFLHIFEHVKGKTPAVFLEFAVESVKNYMFGNESENKVRNSASSAAGHITMVEAVSLVVPQRIPVGIALTGVHISGDVAKAMLPIAQKRVETLTKLVDQMCSQEQDHSCLNARWQRMEAEESLLVLEGVKLSSEAIHTLHHTITHTINEACDEVGLTDQNANKALEWWKKGWAPVADALVRNPSLIGHIP